MGSARRTTYQQAAWPPARPSRQDPTAAPGGPQAAPRRLSSPRGRLHQRPQVVEGRRVDGQVDEVGVQEGGREQAPPLPRRNQRVVLQAESGAGAVLMERRAGPRCCVPAPMRSGGHARPPARTLIPQAVSSCPDSICTPKSSTFATSSVSVARRSGDPNSPYRRAGRRPPPPPPRTGIPALSGV